MDFWRLTEPEGTSSQDHATHRNGLPGIECSACKETHGGVRVLPYKIPKCLEADPNFSTPRTVSSEIHRSLRTQLADALNEEHQGLPLFTSDAFRPGDSFCPLEIQKIGKSRPDFLWFDFPVVSRRVKELLTPLVNKSVHFEKVSLKHGTVRKLSQYLNFEYYEMVILNNSKPPPGANLVYRCPECFLETYANDRLDIQLVMTDEMRPQCPIFLWFDSLYVVIDDEIKRAVEESGFTNCDFIKFPKEQFLFPKKKGNFVLLQRDGTHRLMFDDNFL